MFTHLSAGSLQCHDTDDWLGSYRTRVAAEARQRFMEQFPGRDDDRVWLDVQDFASPAWCNHSAQEEARIRGAVWDPETGLRYDPPGNSAENSHYLRRWWTLDWFDWAQTHDRRSMGTEEPAT